MVMAGTMKEHSTVNNAFATQHVASSGKIISISQASTYLHLRASPHTIRNVLQDSYKISPKSTSTFLYSNSILIVHNNVFIFRLFVCPIFVQLIYQVIDYIFTFLFYNHPT